MFTGLNPGKCFLCVAGGGDPNRVLDSPQSPPTKGDEGPSLINKSNIVILLNLMQSGDDSYEEHDAQQLWLS